MIVITGKSCSGKTSIVNSMEQRGWEKVVSYTTRPKRKEEIDGVDYHFIKENDFINKIENNLFVEHQVYNTAFGKWYYGTSKESLIGDNKVVVLTSIGLRQLKEKMKLLDIVSFYIDVCEPVQRKRLINRGDNKKELERRINSDENDFKTIINETDFTISNNGDLSLEEIVDMIIYAYYGVKELKTS